MRTMKILLAAFLALAPLAASAQQTFNPGPIPDPTTRAAVRELGDTRWMDTFATGNISTANSVRVGIPIPGHLLEAWVVVTTAITKPVTSANPIVTFAISRNLGAMISVDEIAGFGTTVNMDLGGIINVRFPTGKYLLNEGDVLVIGAQTCTSCTGIYNVTVRAGL